MEQRRWKRDEFFAQLAPLDEDELTKVLWTLYWRGSARMRERIEAQLDPEGHERRQRAEQTPPNASEVLAEVREFTALARKGAYLARDRRVSPRERTRWRFTFRRLADAAQAALATDDVDAAASAVEELVDLACSTKRYDRFRSEDPVEAARFVVSDAVALLWQRLREHHGFHGFTERAAPQLIRWEEAYGWTRHGYGKIAEQETSLAVVLSRMLTAQDMWIAFAERYLDALDRVAERSAGRPKRSWERGGWQRWERTRALVEWHGMLLDRLAGDPEAEGLLDRLVDHPALEGPELLLLGARLAHRRGDTERARDLLHDCLEDLPGHREALAFAEGSTRRCLRAPCPGNDRTRRGSVTRSAIGGVRCHAGSSTVLPTSSRTSGRRCVRTTRSSSSRSRAASSPPSTRADGVRSSGIRRAYRASRSSSPRSSSSMCVRRPPS